MNESKNSTKMKTRNIIALSILALNLNVALAFAGNDGINSRPADENLYPVFKVFAPAAPAEAEFEDGMAVYSAEFLMSKWAPVTPKEADFSDLVPETANTITVPSAPKEATFDDEYVPEPVVPDSLINALAPVTPCEATFTGEDNYINLAPVTPREADFDEAI